jgi:hypothetical protein
VLDGVASCPFVAQGYGQGTITAEYSPPTDNPSYLGSTGTASIISYLTTYTGVVSALVPDNAPAQITVEVWDQLGPSFPPPPLNGSQENNEPVESYVDISYYECPSTTTSSSTSTSTSTSTNLADTCSSTPIFSPPDEVPLTSTGSDGRPQAVDTNWTYNPTQIPPGTTIEVVASYVGAAYWYQSPNVIATFTVPT